MTAPPFFEITRHAVHFRIEARSQLKIIGHAAQILGFIEQNLIADIGFDVCGTIDGDRVCRENLGKPRYIRAAKRNCRCQMSSCRFRSHKLVGSAGSRLNTASRVDPGRLLLRSRRLNRRLSDRAWSRLFQTASGMFSFFNKKLTVNSGIMT